MTVLAKDTDPTNSTAEGRPKAPARTYEWYGTTVAKQTMILTGRSLRALWSNPAMVALGLIGPLIILVLFGQAFATIANTPGFPKNVGYIDYLMPAILVSASLGAAVQSGTGLLNDMRSGVVSRFRALPISSVSVVLARSLSDGVRTAFQLGVMLLLGALVFGFNPSGGFVGVLAAWALCLTVGWCLCWAFMAMGTWIRNVEMLSMVNFILMFPLMFASSAYLPIKNLPGWLQIIAKVNPMSYAIDASRALVLGTPAGSGVVAALATSAALGLIGSRLAVLGFRRAP